MIFWNLIVLSPFIAVWINFFIVFALGIKRKINEQKAFSFGQILIRFTPVFLLALIVFFVVDNSLDEGYLLYKHVSLFLPFVFAIGDYFAIRHIHFADDAEGKDANNYDKQIRK